MKRLFGYVRVSTTRQAEKGVSLKEQRDAIASYAAKHDAKIVDWYEEHQTAAKRGRPVFSAMLKALRRGKAEGIVIHKIDRSARNLGDWADLGELIDAGFDIHLAHEPLDLRSRGGRLSADILAVVAADFIRNNRDEARKGFYGRLKEGIYPLGAPIGYEFRGRGGRASRLDQKRAPLIRYAFEQYASGEVSLLALLEALKQKGLRNRAGKPLSLTGLVTILRNPFYAGVIRLRKTGETFIGTHEPIVRMETFREVQDLMDGKRPRRTSVHDYLYRRLFACGNCGRSLIGSMAKGRVYYRCSVPSCPTTSVREDALDGAVTAVLRSLALPAEDIDRCKTELQNAMADQTLAREASRTLLNGRLGAITTRLGRLTDAYIESRIERDAHDERRGLLLMERKEVTDALQNLENDQAKKHAFLLRCVELSRDPENLYRLASPENKRRILRIATSNRVVSGKTVSISRAEPFCYLSKNPFSISSALDRGQRRTSHSLAEKLLAWAERSKTCEKPDEFLLAC